MKQIELVTLKLTIIVICLRRRSILFSYFLSVFFKKKFRATKLFLQVFFIFKYFFGVLVDSRKGQGFAKIGDGKQVGVTRQESMKYSLPLLD